jgi:excisionase family DNA binding protein
VARTRLNPRLAKVHRSYTVEEIARLYGLHRNTVRAWLKGGGLKVLDHGRPVLILGRELRSFLEARRTQAKSPCPPGTLYCLRCRRPRPPALGMADYMARPTGAGDLEALCGTCGAVMHRRTRQDQVAAVLPGVAVRVTQAPPRIGDSPAPCLKQTQKEDVTT